MEVGPKDLKQKQCVVVRRDTGEKIVLSDGDVEKKITHLLEEIQDNLFKRYTPVCINVELITRINLCITNIHTTTIIY